ncbi:hypothetical protein EVAR_24140_1 [Eumeta japonica]|uniref:Uncharacterized protein n=1 Tax=Eumeta variegata TaxID=151549 RepID=A0A4C1YR08_EUMVA|nr:hypothetical protein EVAR_24140_1 [Eumeta japonica]
MIGIQNEDRNRNRDRDWDGARELEFKSRTATGRIPTVRLSRRDDNAGADEIDTARTWIAGGAGGPSPRPAPPGPGGESSLLSRGLRARRRLGRLRSDSMMKSVGFELEGIWFDHHHERIDRWILSESLSAARVPRGTRHLPVHAAVASVISSGVSDSRPARGTAKVSGPRLSI